MAEDASDAICTRVQSDHRAGNAGWLHRFTDIRPGLLPLLHKSEQAAPQSPKAAPDVLDAAYRTLLGELVLATHHRDNLQRRGLTDHDINRLGYKSFPIYGRAAIVDRLQANGITLTGVPGFWLDSGKVRLAGPDGIAIPVRDLRGRIQGLQVRCDNADRGKYKWLSSNHKNEGASPGAPVHVARPAADCESAEVWVTEGALKADIAALKLRRVFLAVAGVGNWPGAIPVIRETRPERVAIAFDCDTTERTRKIVSYHEAKLTNALLGIGARVFRKKWNPTYKGIDDYLAAQERKS
ncbi:MAG: DUF3854 domain-containing protein [Chloroflexi bacterium]|nr:DUF3854 domain-containing protein [Chloroflexota bacterium]